MQTKSHWIAANLPCAISRAVDDLVVPECLPVAPRFVDVGLAHCGLSTGFAWMVLGGRTSDGGFVLGWGLVADSGVGVRAMVLI